LGALLSTAATSALAKPPTRSIYPKLRPAKIRIAAAGSVTELIASSRLSGKIGFVVADAISGEILETHNPKLALPPGSVAKTATTLYALNVLGAAHRFKTQIVITGPIENGRVKGDLYLLGGGDPTLDTDALGALAKRLKEAGVREISGRAFVYSGALPYSKSIDPGQPDHLGYNPSLSGLNLNYNRVYFEWKRSADGYDVSMDARAIKYRPRVASVKIRVVNRKGPVFAFKSDGKIDSWTVSQNALGRKGGRWLPVRHPGLYTADVFHTLARSFGIQLPAFRVAKVRPKGTVVAQWQSPNLAKILRGMMKFSNNMTAETVGLTATQRLGSRPANLKASGRRMAAWMKEKAGTKTAKFVDHSGLGDGSRVSADDLNRVLLTAGWNGSLHVLMKSIAVRGDDGKPLKNSPIKVRGKTGTLNFVSALAGYIEAPGGRKLTFAFFSADLVQRSKIPRAERERPRGARAWRGRSKALQQSLIRRWVTTFDV